MLKDFNSKTVGIFGAGFVGENVIKKLAKSGHRIKIASRNPYLKQNLKLLGEMGQIELIKIALESAQNRVVVKQPRYAETRDEITKHSHQILGRTIRYDVYMKV